MPNRLKNVKLDFVSLVDNPAGIGAEVVLFKRDADEEDDEIEDNEDIDDVDDGGNDQEHEELIDKYGRKISTKRLKALREAHTLLSGILDQVPDDSADEDDGVKKQLTKYLIMESSGDLMAELELKTQLSEEDQAAVEKFIEETEARIAELEGEVAKAAEKDDEDNDETETEEDLTKSANPIVARLAKRLADAEAEATEANIVAKLERDNRLEREHIAKCANDYPALPLGAEKLGPVMKRLEEKSPKEYAEIASLLKAASVLIKDAKPVGQQHGSDHGGEMDVTDEFSSHVTKAMTDNDKLSYTDAVTKVAGEHPDLYRAVRKASSNKAGD